MTTAVVKVDETFLPFPLKRIQYLIKAKYIFNVISNSFKQYRCLKKYTCNCI